ncbi:MAG: LacI family DNA-binding transcriptional regulator [Lentisphaeria bacterium]|nr:LacI family DNA-binding transcriptional regulator [Lentisphaeria bacterium]
MMVTLKDIAARVGVSINTVSHALKGNPDIGAETARRIRSVASEMGYRPNPAARSLVSKHSFTIGLAVTEIDNPVRVEFCEKLRILAAQDGYRLLTAALTDNWRKSFDDLLNHHVDGVIIGAVWDAPGDFESADWSGKWKNEGIPIVSFGKHHLFPGDSVEIDLENSVYQLTRHLQLRGYDEIALLAPPKSIANFRGYERAMVEAGRRKMIRRLNLSLGRMEVAYQDMTRFLDSGKKLPRAIVAANDLSALGAVRALHEHGIKIPEQCAVAGVDNIGFARYSVPSLTSIGFDNGLCAKTVWKLMARRLKNQEKRAAVRTVIQQKLFIREST